MKHDSRNLKYGTTATMVSAALIVAVILLNVIFSALQSKYALYTDMTSSMTYTLSDEVKEVLSDVTEPVKILFCNDRDYLEGDAGMRDILLTAENLDREFDWLEVECVNSVADPTKVAKYRLNTSDAVLTTNVIVESGDEYRKLSYKSFYVVDTDGQTVWGLQAEEKFASAILSVTAAEKPIAYFTTTHGEELSPSLLETFGDAGYDILPIDLMKEDIDPDARILIINGPQYDFSSGYNFSSGAQSADEAAGITDVKVEKTVSEIEKIDQFLTMNYGSLMVFLDPYAKDLTELERYLYEWGFVFDNNIVKDTSQAISVDGQSIVAEYCTDETLASSLLKTISSLATKPKTIFKDAGTLSVAQTFSPVMNEDENTGEQTGPSGAYSSSSSVSTRDISPVFTTSANAVANGQGAKPTEQVKIPAPLMMISRQTRVISNDYYYSYVLCANTTSFDDEEFTRSNVYANRDVLFAAMKQMGRESVPSGIDFKEYNTTYDIEDMTTAQANGWTTVLLTVLPVAFILCGVIVCVRRKYR